MTDGLNPQPSTWGKDDLSAFFEAARSNAFATHHNHSVAYKRMSDIDALYLGFFEKFENPEDTLGAGLALRCHSALRAAAKLTLSGQVPESFMVLRGALELALYAHHASTSGERAQIWMNRHDSAETKRQCSQEFTGRVIFPTLREKASVIGDIAGELYERCIDYGAHPNARGVLTTMSYEEDQQGQSFSFAYLSGDTLSLRFALKSWCQVSICALDVLGLVFPKRFTALKMLDQSAPLRAGL